MSLHDARKAAVLPAGPRLPRSLQTLGWLADSTSFLAQCRRRYGDVFTLDLVPRVISGPGAQPSEGRWVFLADPEHVERLFTADPVIVRTGETNRFLRDLVGPRSILVLDEPEHMTQRRLMLPPLHGDRIKRYAALMSAAARAELERWPVGERFRLWPSMQAITLEVIVRAVFGVGEPGVHDELRRRLLTLLNRMTSTWWLASMALVTSLPGGRGVADHRLVRSMLDPLDDVVLGEIRRRRAPSDLEGGDDDILTMLMGARYEDGSAMTDFELRDELITLLIAGHESTATALVWAFERLLRHPSALARLRDEVAAGDGSQYADAVVKETLRLRPVLSIVLRKLAEPLEIGGHLLPRGTWVAPCISLIHRREDVYPEPQRFRPERFLERPAGTYTWMPFGGGVRRCLGASFAQLEMQEVLRTVVAHADLAPAPAADERTRRRFITLAPSRGGQVVMTGRTP